jgi:DNA-binding response OmpR family regulator
MEEKILIVADAQDENDLILTYLENASLAGIQAISNKEAHDLILRDEPNLIIVSDHIKGLDLPDFCFKARKITNAPILCLSDESASDEKVDVFSNGADDYMTRPVDPVELIARIKAHLRRQRTGLLLKSSDSGQSKFRFPGLTIDIPMHEVLVDGEPVRLAPKEFEVLCILVRNRNKIISNQQLFELAWQSDGVYASDTKTVMVCVSKLRRKIETNPNNPHYIINVRGKGYKFNHHIFEV